MMTAADLERLGYEIIDGKAVKKRPAPPPPVLDPSATPGIGPTLEPPVAVVAGSIPWVPPPDVTKSERELLIPVPRPMVVARGGSRAPVVRADRTAPVAAINAVAVALRTGGAGAFQLATQREDPR